MSLDLMAAALGYARLGLPVFPLRPNRKEPLGRLVPRGFHDASTDASTVAAWWADEPRANVGLRTGVVVDVLDVDVRVDGNGWAALDAVNRAGLLRGVVGIASTRNAGAHFYYPASGHGCSTVKGSRLDFKAAGGYVVAPPSRVPADEGVNGSGAYSWTEPLDLNHCDAAPLEWAGVVELLTPRPISPPSSRRSTSSREWSGVTVNAEHLVRYVRQLNTDRNNGLYWAARRLVEGGIDPECLRAPALSTGLTALEVDRTLDSARVGPRA